MSFYVPRRNRETGREGWTGPIRSNAQAQREVAAWEEAGWDACALESSPEIRSAVRAWERENVNR